MSLQSALTPTELDTLVPEARERRRLRFTRVGPWAYQRFIHKFRDIPEGSVVLGEHTLVYGYGKIGRILQLEAGLKAQFQQPFWVEEKIDGYNVRVVNWDGHMVAFSRRGYICPFTTDRLPDLVDTRILQDHPELVLCTEVAGPENPYNEGSPPFIRDDVRLFVFDIMHKNRPGCLPHRDKAHWIERYGLPAVPGFGRHHLDATAPLKSLILELDRDGREGLVFKEDSPRDHRIKYVTGRTNISDIRVTDGAVKQLPPEYFMYRILRLALFLEEHGIEPTDRLRQDLGDALLRGIMHSVEQVRDQGQVFHRFRCRFRERANAELMLATLRRHLGRSQLRVHRLEKQGSHYVAEFDKAVPRTSDLLGHFLAGGVVFD